MGSFETTGTTTEDINAVTTTTTIATFSFELFIIEEASDASFKMQLKRYRHWEKKIKAIKSFDNFVI